MGKRRVSPTIPDFIQKRRIFRCNISGQSTPPESDEEMDTNLETHVFSLA